MKLSILVPSVADHITIQNMRFYLRMSGLDNIKNYTNKEVVELFNKIFGKNKKFVGIDRQGNNIN